MAANQESSPLSAPLRSGAVWLRSGLGGSNMAAGTWRRREATVRRASAMQPRAVRAWASLLALPLPLRRRWRVGVFSHKARKSPHCFHVTWRAREEARTPPPAFPAPGPPKWRRPITRRLHRGQSGGPVWGCPARQFQGLRAASASASGAGQALWACSVATGHGCPHKSRMPPYIRLCCRRPHLSSSTTTQATKTL